MNSFENWMNVMLAAAGSFVAAAVGLAMKYAHKVQRGEKIERMRIWLDAPMIVFAGWCGLAVHEYFQVPEVISYIAASLITYLGEKSITIFVDAVRDKLGSDKEDKGE